MYKVLGEGMAQTHLILRFLQYFWCHFPANDSNDQTRPLSAWQRNEEWYVWLPLGCRPGAVYHRRIWPALPFSLLRQEPRHRESINC